ncbi:MAG: hypothetical protein GC160_03040 [Acidobacteria bacterium]|nr:hypothetical protein [Acidobacteriota bacterium]
MTRRMLATFAFALMLGGSLTSTALAKSHPQHRTQTQDSKQMQKDAKEAKKAAKHAKHSHKENTKTTANDTPRK